MKKSANKPAALDHVLYEIEMATHSLLQILRLPQLSLEKNAWLEVYAIHARNLNEFFSDKDFGKAYMRPSHFGNWDFQYGFDSSLARRASAEVAHLTYDRQNGGEKKGWSVGAYFEPLRDAALDFLNQISLREDLMAFQKNRERCNALLKLLPRFEFKLAQQSGPDNPRPFGTSGMPPADSAARAGDMPEASGGI